MVALAPQPTGLSWILTESASAGDIQRMNLAERHWLFHGVLDYTPNDENYFEFLLN